MNREQQKAIELEHLAEHYKGNPVINGRHVVDGIHNANPDVVFPQIPKLMALQPQPHAQTDLHQEKGRDLPSQHAALSASSSHTPPQEVLSLCPNALNQFINKSNKSWKWEKDFMRFIEEDYGGQTPDGAFFRYGLAVAYEKQPYFTPREVIFQQFAAMPPSEASSFKTNLKSSDVDAFILNHEVGHKYSETLAIKRKGNGALSQNNPDFQALAAKKELVSLLQNRSEPYGHYLEEAFCDTFASLQHLKNGGSTDFLQTMQDARAHGFFNNEAAYLYPTHTALKAVTENAQSIQKRLAGSNQEDVLKMAAGIVGEHCYDREDYYEHAMVAQTFAKSRNPAFNIKEADWAHMVQDEQTPIGKLWAGYCSGGANGASTHSKQHEGKESVSNFIKGAREKHLRSDNKYYLGVRQRLFDAPLAQPEDYNAELLGQIKYVISKHPEKTPELVLREREAFLRGMSKKIGKDMPQHMRDANDGVRAHLAEKRAASLARERQNEHEHQHENEHEKPPAHDSNHRPNHGLER